MLNFRAELAEIISRTICRQLTQNMDYKSLKLQFDKTRQQRAEIQALDYSLNTIQQLKKLQRLEPELHVNTEIIRSDTIDKIKDKGFGRRVSILKPRKNSTVQIKCMVSGRMSKRIIMKNRKQSNNKGLIKLKSEEAEEQSYLQYIQKQRQRKIKLAQVFQQFTEAKQKQNMKQMKTTMRETNNTDRQFITTLAGQLIKCQKKETKSKKDELYLNKIRIKPIFRLREQVNSKGEVQRRKQIRTETRRVSISNELKGTQNQIGKEDNFYIKSIIDVITTRQQLDHGKRRKNVFR